MKKFIILSVVTILLAANVATAQDSDGSRKRTTISISNNGIKVNSEDKDTDETGPIQLSFLTIDLGINALNDRSGYSAPVSIGNNYSYVGPKSKSGIYFSNNTTSSNQELLQMSDQFKNESLFNLQTAKSINVNIWPVLVGFRMLNTNKQKIYFNTGAGLQIYNFRFSKPVVYENDASPQIYYDTEHTYTKNKLGISYLSIPVGLTFKTRASDKLWLVYGAGISTGYRVASWTKRVTQEQGKQKNHDKFFFNDFNTCITAEAGLSGYFRLYASYQITPLHQHSLLQYPISVGIRFGGI